MCYVDFCLHSNAIYVLNLPRFKCNGKKFLHLARPAKVSRSKYHLLRLQNSMFWNRLIGALLIKLIERLFMIAPETHVVWQFPPPYRTTSSEMSDPSWWRHWDRGAQLLPNPGPPLAALPLGTLWGVTSWDRSFRRTSSCKVDETVKLREFLELSWTISLLD